MTAMTSPWMSVRLSRRARCRTGQAADLLCLTHLATKSATLFTFGTHREPGRGAGVEVAHYDGQECMRG